MMPSRPSTVVLGGGIAGLSAALNLAQRGCRVTLLERDASLGGNARTVCCKAIDGECQLCGGCLLADRIRDVRASSLITVLTDTTVSRIQSGDGGFLVHIENGAATTSAADAIVVATGFDHVDAHTKGPYGFGILPHVTTGQEMEERLTREGQSAYDDLGLERVAFIQCVGSRDEHVGHGYCSQVCCRYALRLARLLRSRLPDVEVTVFKMDLQHAGRDMTDPWEAVQDDKGIHIISGLPAILRQSATNPKRIAIRYNNVLDDDILSEADASAPYEQGGDGSLTEDEFDLVVLSVGMQPRDDAQSVADLVGINRDRFGFFASHADTVSTLVPGVFLAGTCQAPRSMSESVAHGLRAAEACYRYVQETRL